jgi:hypothetical protein
MRARSHKITLGIKTYLNGTLTGNIVIDTRQVATDTTYRPKRPYRKLYPMATRGQLPAPATRPLRSISGSNQFHLVRACEQWPVRVGSNPVLNTRRNYHV